MLALEEESKQQLYEHGKEISFFRHLILDGQWEDAENFLRPLKMRVNFQYDSVIFELRKQKFLELLENQVPDSTYLVSALKEIESMCSKETFHSLCYCLTLSKLNDHPDYQDWTVQKGRLECFEKAKAHLDLIYAQSTDGKKTQSGRLRKLIQDALSY